MIATRNQQTAMNLPDSESGRFIDLFKWAYKTCKKSGKGKSGLFKLTGKGRGDRIVLTHQYDDDGDMVTLLYNTGPESASVKTVEPEEDYSLNLAYVYAENGQARNAAAVVMSRLDKLLLAGSYRECDELLSQVDVVRLVNTPTVLVAFVGITATAKGHLRTRAKLFKRIKQALSATIGESRTANILDRFE